MGVGKPPVIRMHTLKLTLEYDGAAYAGWQRQPSQPTIQASLESALQELTQETISAVAAGRTDAGVHALGQVVSFRSARSFTPEDWTRGLNAILPKDIGVRSTETVDQAFHARYHALTKVYEYRIVNDRRRPVLDRARVWHIQKPLHLDVMREAASCLVGRQNCLSFQSSPTDNTNPLCHIHCLEIHDAETRIHIRIKADRFLKQMVRSIVGTLVEVGLRQRNPSDLHTILASQDRRAAGKTAPAHGLYLVEVLYPEPT